MEFQSQVTTAEHSRGVEALKAELKTGLRASGAKIQEEGSNGGDGFHLAYTEGASFGWIEVWRGYGEDSDYRLMLLIDERN